MEQFHGKLGTAFRSLRPKNFKDVNATTEVNWTELDGEHTPLKSQDSPTEK
jgi:hypothetical protein